MSAEIFFLRLEAYLLQDADAPARTTSRFVPFALGSLKS